MSIVAFIHDLAFEDLPEEVVAQAKRCILDLIGVAAAGKGTDLARIAGRFAAGHMAAGARPARMLLDGRPVSPAGAAYAGASTIDSFDAHDGHPLTKGHAGVAVLPALLAVADAEGAVDNRAFLTSLVLGYEIATRAGIALHASVSDYHTSGAWNALGCAAIVARHLGLGAEATRHALGIAEYHGPRSQMMRCIDHPTMVKDGSGWGAFAGVAAGYLAADGFSGEPAFTVEAAEQAGLWSDLGARWRILEQYFKPYPVCRWAQPAVEAATGLLARHGIRPERIEAIRVDSFAEAVRLGAREPATTEQAQYAIAFPLAAYLVRGRLGGAEIGADGLQDPEIQAMTRRIVLREDETLSRRFPAERLAIVTIEAGGRAFSSEPTGPRGDPASPLPDEELRAKYHALSAGLGDERAARIEALVARLDQAAPCGLFLDAVLSAPA